MRIRQPRCTPVEPFLSSTRQVLRIKKVKQYLKCFVLKCIIDSYLCLHSLATSAIDDCIDCIVLCTLLCTTISSYICEMNINYTCLRNLQILKLQ